MTEEKNLDGLCFYYDIAYSQLEAEVIRLKTAEGCTGYIKTGCYDCNGRNYLCDKYYNYQPKRKTK